MCTTISDMTSLIYKIKSYVCIEIVRKYLRIFQTLSGLLNLLVPDYN